MPSANTFHQFVSTNKSALFITLHKCATSFFARYVLPAFKERNNIDYQMTHYMNKKILTVKVRRYGYIYGPIRILDREHPSFGMTSRLLKKKNLHNKKAIFMIRDPRDILVSMYYSFGFSHGLSPNPQIKAYQMNRRRKIQQMTVDEYARVTAPLLQEKFDFIESLIQTTPDKLLLKYEDLILDFEKFYRHLNDYLPLNEDVKEILHKHTRPPKKENPLNHKRKGNPGDYKNKLNPDTINYLDKIFKRTLNDFHYEPH